MNRWKQNFKFQRLLGNILMHFATLLALFFTTIDRTLSLRVIVSSFATFVPVIVQYNLNNLYCIHCTACQYSKKWKKSYDIRTNDSWTTGWKRQKCTLSLIRSFYSVAQYTYKEKFEIFPGFISVSSTPRAPTLFRFIPLQHENFPFSTLSHHRV